MSDNTFVSAVINQTTRTTNGMQARKFTALACVDLFFKIAASRGKNITSDFAAAYVENKELALRIAQWSRDVRGGAGEREVFRQILKYLDNHNTDAAIAILKKIPEIGRWDDIFVVEHVKEEAFKMLANALSEKNALAAKWAPRKGNTSLELRKFLKLNPKEYRKLLVNLTNVVETQMCAKDWNSINFSHVPSVAAARYKNAFYRNAEEAYTAYVQSLVNGKTTVNASAVYPYDILKGLVCTAGNTDFCNAQLDLVVKQWEALENFVGDANVLAIVDVSGSMTCSAGKSSSLTCLDVAVSLGLYVADKNTGKFGDTFLTFSEHPELMHLKGNIVEKLAQMMKSNLGFNTNIVAAMDIILTTALNGNVPKSEMPEILLIFSDMQFDECAHFDDSAMQMIERRFADSGYCIPKIVFWNLNARDNVPVKYDACGVALVSGFSPAIMKTIFTNDKFTPESIMLDSVMTSRYDITI